MRLCTPSSMECTHSSLRLSLPKSLSRRQTGRRAGVSHLHGVDLSGNLVGHRTDISPAVIPWGRFAPLRPDLPNAATPEEEGGNGAARKFWEWNEEQVKHYI